MANDAFRRELDGIQDDDLLLQSFARTLVQDDYAGDLVQEAYVAALEALESGKAWTLGKLGPWLRGTMKNLMKMRYRTDYRREERERKVAPPEETDEDERPEMRLAEAEMRQLMMQTVLMIPDPYRDALLMQHQDGMSVKAIAAELKMTEKGVETRLARARQKAREIWDRHFPDGGSFLGLLPLLFPATIGGLAKMVGTGATLFAVETVRTPWWQSFLQPKVAGAGLILAAAAGLLWWQPWKDHGPPPNEEDLVAAGPAAEQQATGTPSMTGEGVERDALEATPPADEEEVVAIPQGREVYLYDRATGAPMAGITMRVASLRPATREERLRGPTDRRFFRPRERVWWRLEEHLATTGADGLLAFTPHAEATHVIHFLDIHAAGHSIEDYSRGRRIVALGGTPARLELAMVPRTFEARGKVLDHQGRPVADARVDLTYDWILQPPLAPQREVTTLPDGSFTVPALANDQGGVRLVPRKEGYVARQSLSIMRLADRQAAYEELELRLAPAAPREVTVIDAGGLAVDGATLLASPAVRHESPEASVGSYTDEWRDRARTGADGRARLGAVPAEDFLLRVEAPGALPWEGVVSAATRDVQVRLPRGRTMPVQVLDAAGHPLAGATVLTMDRHQRRLLRTDADGQVDALVATDGPVYLAVAADGHAHQARLLAAAEVAPQRIDLLPELRIQGRLSDWPGRAQGAPPPQVFVEDTARLPLPAELERKDDLPVGVGGSLSVTAALELDAVEPAADGSFSVGGLAPGTHEVWAGERFRPLAFTTASASDAAVELAPGDGLAGLASLDLRLSSLATGNPMRAYYVVIRRLDEGSGRFIAQPTVVVQAADGRVRVDGLRPGTFQLLLWAPAGYTTLALPPGRLEAGTKVVEEAMVPAGAMRLRLVTPDGNALGGATVEAVTPRGPIFFSGARLLDFLPTRTTRRDGSLTLSGVPATQAFTLLVSRDGRSASIPVQVDPSGAVQEVVADLR